MNLQPVKSYKSPQYPEKEIILANPEILKSVPKSWNNNISTKIAFSSLLLMLLTACAPKYSNSDKGMVPENTSGTSVLKPAVPETKNTGRDTSSKKAATAPIFEHGDGNGSFGCVSVSPPVFLSEEEAFQIIRDVAQKSGISIKKSSEILKDVQIPVTYTCPISYVPDPENPDISIAKYPDKTKENGILSLDGDAKDGNIAFEFVSVDDFKGWHGESSIMSSVENYNVLAAAKTLREGISNKTEGKYIGIFYDPIGDNSSKSIYSADSTDKARDLSKKLLSEQVKDFIEWLKAEGVI